MGMEVSGQEEHELPDAIFHAAAKDAGEQVFGLLLAEETWIHRRVETIDMLSTQFLRRSISVDFTLPEGARSTLALPTIKQSLVPISTLAKRPLRNFDLRDETGKAVPVLGRDHNGPLAHSVLLAVVGRALSDAGLGRPSRRLIDDLQRIAVGDVAEADRTIRRIVELADTGQDSESRVILNDDATLFLLADLADNYVLVALCDDVEARRILKFSYEEPLETSKPNIVERLGWQPQLVELDAPGASRAASYHAEIVVPEELRFEACFLYDKESDEVYAEDNEADRAALHAARVPLGARTALLFALRAERTSFPVVGCAVAWITSGLLLGGVLAGELSQRQADPAVSVLLAASAVFAGVIARSGEHRMVQNLFAGPRLLLALTALSALLAAGALAYGVSSTAVDTIWTVAAAISLAAAVMLTGTLVAARPIALGERQ